MRRPGFKPGSSRLAGRIPGAMRRFGPAMARAGLKRTAYGAAVLGAAAVGRGLYKKFRSKKSSIHQKALPNIPGHGSGGTFSVYNMRSKMSKWNAGLKKTGASNFTYLNSSNRATATIGTQSSIIAGQAYTAADINSIQTSGSSNKTFKTLLESCTMKTIYRNQANNDAYLTLYDVVARRDMSPSDTNYNNPIAAWYNGITDTGTTSTMTSQVGATPFDCPKFCQFYKVVKVTHIILPAGGTHEHRVHYEPNRLFNTSITQDSTNMRGLTYFCAAVYYGAPDNDSVTKTQVSTGQVAIDMVQTKQYRFTYLLDATTNNTFTQSLPTAYTISEDVFQDESGTVVTSTTA